MVVRLSPPCTRRTLLPANSVIVFPFFLYSFLLEEQSYNPSFKIGAEMFSKTLVSIYENRKNITRYGLGYGNFLYVIPSLSVLRDGLHVQCSTNYVVTLNSKRAMMKNRIG
jgi:hypothetical protein